MSWANDLEAVLIFLGHPHFFNDITEFDICQYFCEVLGNNLFFGDIGQLDFFYSQLIMDIVVLDIDILSSKVEDWIVT